MTYHQTSSYPVLLKRKPAENTHFGEGCHLVLCTWKGELVIWTEDADGILHGGVYYHNGDLDAALAYFNKLS